MRQNLTIQAPGFLGINTEDSPLELEPGWAAVADNVIIDRYGRVGSRNGYTVKTGDASALGGEKIKHIHQGVPQVPSTSQIFSVGNNKIFKGDTTLTDITVGTPTGDDWHMDTLNDDTFFAQAGHDMLVYDHSADTMSTLATHTNYVANVYLPSLQPDIVHAAYGRLWAASHTADTWTVSWSDLLNPVNFGTGSSGSIDVTESWPHGHDEITAIASHGNRILVFGSHSILVYSSRAADGRLSDPANDLFLEDVIEGIGAINKHSVWDIGTDLLFLDVSGLRSLGRTIQEKSLPIGDLSSNVRTTFRNQISLNTNPVTGVYDAKNGFLLVIMEDLPLLYCFDTTKFMEDGAARVTHWTGMNIACGAVLQDETIYFGNADGIVEYGGYIDDDKYFQMRYYTHVQDFGDPSLLKVPKKACFTVAGGNGQKAIAFWGFDFAYNFKRQNFFLNSGTPDYYNIDEFNITTSDDPLDPTEYDGGGSTIGRYCIPLSSSGYNVILGFEAKIEGAAVSLQEINLQTQIGRMR